MNLKVNISGFSISSDDFSTLKSSGISVFDDFHHAFDGGTLYIKSEDGTEFTFNSGEGSLDGSSIDLSPGKYTVYGKSNSEPSPKGSQNMQYEVHGPTEQSTDLNPYFEDEEIIVW